MAAISSRRALPGFTLRLSYIARVFEAAAPVAAPKSAESLRMEAVAAEYEDLDWLMAELKA
jgi:hypothetical protein